MLELIDQSSPSRLLFRCPACHVVGLSSFSRADEDYFWTATPRGPTEGRWALHECDPADIKATDKKIAAQAAEAAAEIARLAAGGEVEESEPKKRGRPKKSEAEAEA